MEFLSALFSVVSHFLSSYPLLAYFVLFTGAFLDGLVGINFIVRGEIFFLTGSILAGNGVLNIALVSISVIAGGITGDSTSYWLGRWHGRKLFSKNGYIFNETNFERGQQFFDEHGTKTVFFGRFLGPISWITPFVAGTYHVPYNKFLIYNIPGVSIGISQFLVVGYFFGTNYKGILETVQKYAFFSVVTIIALIILYRYARKHRHRIIERIISLWNNR
ncbi:hypothetical protein A3A39_04530 [Candidatus Kaiserbacteria bacterium RIFCSPLOWO2_01_FULL_54_13]|uniref:VTT domain-containing protein n=1 Tax=Candidatus Kaiserbacteria bacterium RIFCSPLOWO2_01_FULL_54_13 TaxID=1798512 RepID=A0A1F6F1L9_9BACT|nr:MAG: hypothetical protein A3A39_04530 [Candidatus Kaiserbacteria bacterium RIFCSPLOWO2_01_FULL_54_13]